MRYEIILAPEAVEDLNQLRAVDCSAVKLALEEHLRFEPQKESKSRIKKLKGLKQPQYRLRINEYRIFYDVTGSEVQVLAIVAKSVAAKWLEEKGEKI